MLHNTKGIILHHIKYGENSVIVYIYTREFGRQSYIINSIRSKKSPVRAGLLQPLFVLDLEVYYRESKSLQRIKEITSFTPFHSIPLHPVKNAIALFLAEILYKILWEEKPEEDLFDFLSNSIEFLDTTYLSPANFHLHFLVRLSRYLGFNPEDNYTATNRFFDMRSGRFKPEKPAHKDYLTPELASLLHDFINSDFVTCDKIIMDHTRRVAFLNQLVRYYQIHNEGLGMIRSLEVLKAVFN